MRAKPSILGVILLIAIGAWAAKETVLYSFSGGSDGEYGGGRPVLDSSGTLYGKYGTEIWGAVHGTFPGLRGKKIR